MTIITINKVNGTEKQYKSLSICEYSKAQIIVLGTKKPIYHDNFIIYWDNNGRNCCFGSKTAEIVVLETKTAKIVILRQEIP